MTHGRIVKLAIKPLQVVSSYDKVMEISTTSLLNTVEEEAVMDIEVMEDMYVAKVFAQEGQQLHVGSPVALLCDNEKDIEHVQGIKVRCICVRYLICAVLAYRPCPFI
jgi:pyruvate/2-oxoglutarate dehydrogenase complex dihydrolipoamide acyltransferase (E2) component